MVGIDGVLAFSGAFEEVESQGSGRGGDLRGAEARENSRRQNNFNTTANPAGEHQGSYRAESCHETPASALASARAIAWRLRD